MNGAPLSYLAGYGVKAYPVTALTWGLGIICLLTIVIVAVLVASGAVLRRTRAGAPAPVEWGSNGARWLSIGMVVSTLALLACMVWTVAVLARVAAPPTAPGLTIEVTGEQWWWRVRYLSGDPRQVFETANEIHIPTGVPVRVRLIGGDVVHSFWAPGLTGKTETIPGQVNVTWMEADTPGRYRGQCTEFCGVEHAKMGLVVIAEPPATFAAWRAAQGQAVAPPAAANAGEAVFEQRCAACHSVRGVTTRGDVGPDLTHVMSRSTLAALALTNTPANLAGWISNPQAIKPGANMPATWLSGAQLTAVSAFVQSLK